MDNAARLPFEGKRGRIRVQYLDDGAPRVKLSREQISIFESIEWVIFPKDIDSVAFKAASHDELLVAVEVTDSFCLWLYSTTDWTRADGSSKPNPECESAVIWDARGASDGTCTVPQWIAASDGERRMHLRATSGSVPDWPVNRGDRVFIELTEARAMQLARASIEHDEAHNPSLYERTLRNAGSVEKLQLAEAGWYMQTGVGDLAHVTEGLRAAIAERQSRAGEAQADKLRDAFKDLLRRIKQERASGEESPMSPWIAEEYRHTLLRFLRADFGRRGALSLRIGYTPARQYDDIPFGATFTRHACVEFPLPTPALWAAMRRDTEYSTIVAAFTHNGSGERGMHFELQWIGITITVGGETIEIGPALLAAAHDRSWRDDDAGRVGFTPQIMLMHWRYNELAAAERYFKRAFGSDDTQLSHELINEAIGIMMPIAEAVAAAGLSNKPGIG